MHKTALFISAFMCSVAQVFLSDEHLWNLFLVALGDDMGVPGCIGGRFNRSTSAAAAATFLDELSMKESLELLLLNFLSRDVVDELLELLTFRFST